MKKYLMILMLLPVFSFAQIATLAELTGVVKVNGREAKKDMVLKEGDQLEAQKNGKALIVYLNKAQETVKNSKIVLSKKRAEKLLKIQKQVEIAKENISVKGIESSSLKENTPRMQEIEKLGLLFANSDYRGIIHFVDEGKFNFRHPDLLFKVGFSYFQTGDFTEAETHFKTLVLYDVPEYKEITQTILSVCNYFKTGKKPGKSNKILEGIY